MTLPEQAEYIIDCFPQSALTDEEINEVLAEWKTIKYPAGGETSALSDLLRMLQDKSLTDKQRQEEAERLASTEKQ